MNRKDFIQSITGIIILVVLIIILVIGYRSLSKPDCASKCTSFSYDSVYNTFGNQSHKTSAQTYSDEELTKIWDDNCRGRCVYWSGKIRDVSKSENGKVTVNIDMGHSFLLCDIRLNIAKESSSRALNLNKGAYINFCGTMDKQPDSWFPMELKEVTIP